MCDTMTAKSNVSCNLFSLPVINIQSMHFFWVSCRLLNMKIGHWWHHTWSESMRYHIYIYVYIYRYTDTSDIYIYIYGLDVFVLLGTQFLCLPEVVWLFCPPPVVSLPAPWRRMWVRQVLFWQNFLRNLSVCRNRLWKRCWKAVGQNRSRSGMLQRIFGIASRRDWKMSSARTWRIGNLCCVICLRCFRWLSCPGCNGAWTAVRRFWTNMQQQLSSCMARHCTMFCEAGTWKKIAWPFSRHCYWSDIGISSLKSRKT